MIETQSDRATHLAELIRWIGRPAEVVIDRPMGSMHPKFPATVYPVNYGHVPGTMAPDGSEIDAYLLGVDQPVERFHGRCIAVIERRADIEGKIVIVPAGQELTDDDISAATRFQERFFDTLIRRA